MCLKFGVLATVNERVNKTLREEFIRFYQPTADIDQFNSALVRWMTHYNWERPHQSLNFKTPMEVAMASPNPNPRSYG